MTSEETVTATLEHNGWRRRFTAAEPRLSEAVEMYEKLGFRVHVEPLPIPETIPREQTRDKEIKCRACFDGVESQYGIIFTKPFQSDGQPCSD